VVLKTAIGSDHRGYSIKKAIKTTLERLGVSVNDMGAYSDEAVDYPEFAQKVAKSISESECDRGVLICGSGIGMAITANKFPGVRAALCHDLNTAKMSRLHNDANVLVFGEIVGLELAQEMLTVWMETPFEGGRHQKRLDLIRSIEKNNFKETV
jgi:ribose 5-phosphate isomerase B